MPPLRRAQWAREPPQKATQPLLCQLSSWDRIIRPGTQCAGETVHNRDLVLMDHNRLAYIDGDGPGNRYIEDGGCDEGGIPRRWGPIIIIREDNTTCISTNLSGKNGQMKELERAFGAYV